MDLQIEGLIAIVTGASVGIGREVALELSQNGVTVALVSRDAKRLAAAQTYIKSQTNGEVIWIDGDVTLPETPHRVVDEVVKKFGRLDILVNNAGRAHSGGLMDSSESDWQSMTDVKLHSMRRFCKAAIPQMQKNHWGRIVNMSSIGGIYPNPHLLISHVLSAGINNFTKSLALEVGKFGILVNAIGIGAVDTENMTTNMLPALRATRPEFSDLSDEEVLKRISAERIPIGRAGQAKDIAAIAAFLASNRNGFITGDTIEASGGADRYS
jgi:3-oxoacyl-[acyl-carrier protein] reductase